MLSAPEAQHKYGLTKTFAVFLVNREEGGYMFIKVKSLKEKGVAVRN